MDLGSEGVEEEAALCSLSSPCTHNTAHTAILVGLTLTSNAERRVTPYLDCLLPATRVALFQTIP